MLLLRVDEAAPRISAHQAARARGSAYLASHGHQQWLVVVIYRSPSVTRAALALVASRSVAAEMSRKSRASDINERNGGWRGEMRRFGPVVMSPSPAHRRALQPAAIARCIGGRSCIIIVICRPKWHIRSGGAKSPSAEVTGEASRGVAYVSSTIYVEACEK